MVGESREAHLPSIQEGQRTLLNLEYLRHSISLLRQAPNEEFLRSTMIGIRALLAEVVFDRRVDGSTLKDLSAPVRELGVSRSRALRLHAVLLGRIHSFLSVCEKHGGNADAATSAALWRGCMNLTEYSAPELEERMQDMTASLPAERRDAARIAARRVLEVAASLREEDARSGRLTEDILARLTAFRVAKSDSEVKLIYGELATISQNAEKIHTVALHLCIGLTCFLALLGWLLHRHLLQPIMQAARTLSDIRNGRQVVSFPSSKIRELDSMIQVLPLLHHDIQAKDARSSELEKEQEKLMDMSFRDALTGISNRRALDTLLKNGLADKNAAILMFDIDLFKQYNDSLGHLAGDEALRRVGEIASRCAGQFCTPYRYGGEEFVIICHGEGARPERVREVAHNLMNLLEAARISHPASPWGRLTMSIGIAFRPTGVSSLHEVLDQADKALYRAKSRGRHRIEEAESDNA